MEAATSRSRGRLLLATVKGDVHDIGKNLVDIVLSNNGFEVVNIGIKVPVSEIIEQAEKNSADAIGMSGLLVKSTIVMRENLQEINLRGVAPKYPVPARRCCAHPCVRRAGPRRDLPGLGALRPRRVRGPATDGRRHGGQARRARCRAARAARAPRHVVHRASRGDADRGHAGALDVATDNSVPTPPFWGSRVVRGVQLNDYLSYLDERATFLGQWGLKPGRSRSSRRASSTSSTAGWNSDHAESALQAHP